MRRAAGTLVVGALSWLPAVASAVPVERVEVVAAYSHDPGAFTQGLVFHQGRLFESTGHYGQSSLRRVEPSTGAVERMVRLSGEHFGEGLAFSGERLLQLTWRSGVAIEYDLDFNVTGSFRYEGEGWGLCALGGRFVMSDGSSTLSFRNAESFAIERELGVRRDAAPVEFLNELECVGSSVYANVWTSDEIVRIDATSGAVLATVDASGLLAPEEAEGADVLNGIAYQPASGHFFVTGKNWPKLFEVRFPGRAAPELAGGGGTGAAPSGESSAGARAEGVGSPPIEPRARVPSGCGCQAPALSATPPFGFAAALLFVALRHRRERG